LFFHNNGFLNVKAVTFQARCISLRHVETLLVAADNTTLFTYLNVVVFCTHGAREI